MPLKDEKAAEWIHERLLGWANEIGPIPTS